MVISFLPLFMLMSNNVFQPSDTIADYNFEMKYTLPQKIPDFPLAKQIDIIMRLIYITLKITRNKL